MDKRVKGYSELWLSFKYSCPQECPWRSFCHYSFYKYNYISSSHHYKFPSKIIMLKLLLRKNVPKVQLTSKISCSCYWYYILKWNIMVYKCIVCDLIDSLKWTCKIFKIIDGHWTTFLYGIFQVGHQDWPILDLRFWVQRKFLETRDKNLISEVRNHLLRDVINELSWEHFTKFIYILISN